MKAETEMSAEKTAEIVKNFFKKVKGAEIKIGARELMDWLDFSVISFIEVTPHAYEIECEFNENLFSDKKSIYKVRVSDKGTILSVERVSVERVLKREKKGTTNVIGV